MRLIRGLWMIAMAGLALAVACTPSPTDAKSAPTFHSEDNPQFLSDWGQFEVASGALELSNGVIPYDLNSALFTDYALKLRTIWIPETAGTGQYRADDYPDFPVGAVISKTFYYPKGALAGDVMKVSEHSGALHPSLQNLDQVRLMETRLLVRRDAGWEALSYVWNSEQTDARLTKIGDAQRLNLVDENGDADSFAYIVPDVNQCAGCHAPNNTTRELAPLGVRPRHLNKTFAYSDGEKNQLDYLEQLGYVSELPPLDQVKANVDWTNAALPLEHRARAYLDINCSHCHNPVGPADTSGLDLTMEASEGPELGVCKLPIAAGSGTGGRLFSIVPGDPEASIVIHRMETTDPGAMMPELGRALQHKEGVELLRDWIAEMEGDCAA